ncbi:MAG: SDR family oxidoreductase [Pikeienuella sp.]
MPDRRTLFCAGFGYSAAALAERLLPENWRVIGTHRNPENEPKLRSAGVEPVLWSDVERCTELLSDASHILVSAAPDAGGDPSLRAMGIALSSARPDWVGYLSTTGVYGDRAGGWVDEDSVLTPATKRGKMRVDAEAEWQATGLPVHIFRLAGIYGPGRGPFTKVLNGTARRIVKPNQVFSRIHRDDIAATLLASINQPRPGAVYNLCDDLAAPPQDVIGYAAELLGKEAPPLIPIEEAEMSPMAASFYSESKRVSNKLIREELGVELSYPTYREGLAADLAAETQ